MVIQFVQQALWTAPINGQHIIHGGSRLVLPRAPGGTKVIWRCPPSTKSKGLGKYKFHTSLKGIQLGSVYISICNRISPEKVPMLCTPGGRPRHWDSRHCLDICMDEHTMKRHPMCSSRLPNVPVSFSSL